MEENVSKGFIRKITVGRDPLNGGKAFQVGGFGPGVGSKVINIVHDHNYLLQYGREKYLIVAEDDQKRKFVWDEIIDMPVVVEYSKPGETQVNVE